MDIDQERNLRGKDINKERERHRKIVKQIDKQRAKKRQEW